VTERTVMAVMGWSSTAMAARYPHVVAAVRRGVADHVGGLLWTPPVDPPKTEQGSGDDGARDGESPEAA
jgi:integrase